MVVSAVGAFLVAAVVVMAAALVQLSSHDSDVGSLAPTDLAALPPTAAIEPPTPSVEYLDVYETAPGGAPAANGAAPGAVSAGSDPSAAAPTGGGSGGVAAAPPAPSPVTRWSPPPTTGAPPEPATTTTRLPGVPADWPADEPIPPMPPGCQKPQLEDNGVWNCDH